MRRGGAAIQGGLRRPAARLGVFALCGFRMGLRVRSTIIVA
jgi:hypothetical protein